MKLQARLEMRSGRSLYRPKDMISAVRLQCEMLPTYLPQKFGWTEPKMPFDPDNLERLIPPDRMGLADNVWWKRSGSNSANGGWMPGAKANSHWPHNGHSTIYMSAKGFGHQEKLIAYLKQGSVHNECDLGFLDSLTQQYLPFARQNGMSPWSDTFSAPTHLLHHWLPDIFWSTVLGPAYVRMFGRECVLSSPAYIVEDLGGETIYLQLTPRLEDTEEHFDEVMAARDKVKQHLGLDSFFQTEKAYDWREHPEMAGNIFRVPEFHLLSN